MYRNLIKVMTLSFTFFILFSFSKTTNAAAENVEPFNVDPGGAGGIVTRSFSQVMHNNAVYMMEYALFDMRNGSWPVLTGMEFAEKVKSGGPWDYKRTYGSKNNYIYNGLNLTGEDLGNMHYGYVGRHAGFSRTLLSSAAGAYQIYSGTSSIRWYASYFDDPNDQRWITYGMDLFSNGSLPLSTPTQPFNLEPTLYGLKSRLSPEERLKVEEEFLKDLKEYNESLIQNN